MIKAVSTALFVGAITFTPVTRAEAGNRDEVIGALIVGGLIGMALANSGQAAQDDQSASPQNEAQPTQRQVVMSIQTALNYFGFNAGPIDGIAGSGTRRAISRFQGAAGYPVGAGQLTQDQFEFLMSAYNWALSGGAAQTGLIGQALLIAYRDGSVSPAPAPAPAPAPVPQPQAAPVPTDFTGTWNTEHGALNLVQYIIGNDRFVIGDYAGRGIIVGRVYGSCASGVFTNESQNAHGQFRFNFDAFGELDGDWVWDGNNSIGSWDGSFADASVGPMRNFADGASFPVSTGLGVNSQSGLWAMNNLRVGQMHSMVVNDIWVGDLNPDGFLAALSNDGVNYYGVMVDHGTPTNVSFSMDAGRTGTVARGHWEMANGRTLPFDMRQTAYRSQVRGAPVLDSDVLPCR